MTPRFISWFAGVGCFDLAFLRAGWTCAGACEFAAFPRKVYAARFGHEPMFSDINEVKANDIPEAEAWVGGFPCTDVSTAGKRAGIAAETRSGLIWRLLDLWDACPRVEWLILENVPGLLSGRNEASATADAGHDQDRWEVDKPAEDLAWMGIILGALADRGLRWAYRVLDARFFGVPQRRRRVFIVARRSRDGAHPREVLFESTSGGRHPAAGGKAGTGAAYSLTTRAGDARQEAEANLVAAALRTNSACDQAGDESKRVVANALTASAGHHGHSSPRGDGSDNLIVAASLTSGGHPGSNAPGRRREDDENLVLAPIPFDLAQVTSKDNRARCDPGAPNGTLASTGQAMVAYQEPIPIDIRHTSRKDCSTGVGTESTGIGRPGDAAFGLGANAATQAVAYHVNAATAKAPAVLASMAVRRITPLEAERLQGLPDGHTCLCGVTPYSTAACKCKDGNRYKVLGNAVCVNVVEWIARRLASCT